jgi:hypothetical protein
MVMAVSYGYGRRRSGVGIDSGRRQLDRLRGPRSVHSPYPICRVLEDGPERGGLAVALRTEAAARPSRGGADGGRREPRQGSICKIPSRYKGFFENIRIAITDRDPNQGVMRKYFRGLRAKCTGPATRRTALGELAPTPAIDIRGPSRQGAARAPLPKVRATDAGSDLERGPRRSGPTFSDAAALRALGAAGGDLPDPSHQAQPRVRLLQIVFGLAHGHRSRPHLLCRRQHTVRRGGDTRCAPGIHSILSRSRSEA